MGRFETLPCVQAQIDWGECGTIDVGGAREKKLTASNSQVDGLSIPADNSASPRWSRHYLESCLLIRPKETLRCKDGWDFVFSGYDRICLHCQCSMPEGVSTRRINQLYADSLSTLVARHKQA